MLGKFFKKKNKTSENAEVKDITILAPVSGERVSLEDVPDPVFSQKMMGNGAAIQPKEGKIYAPVNADVIQVFPTKHAIGLKASNGAEILIHVGLETVGLEGEGFTAKVKEGDKVNQGDLLLEFDMDVIKEKAKDTVTPVIITNTDDMSEIAVDDTAKELTAGEHPLLRVSK
ncbi:PTS glucose transporter subunit IIA [Virgibacillus sp. MSP4-1]|uniref:PTS sugar transporter subunit IIA n=1 Tax=Virgibacillus sp. MSP4-1 TaxID=2700081 RepID=UPI0003A15845|nr:PTS glucose transporter subunit IIA [Virgibacillus sp. MSP4-1]QHS21838.1 PTS glucose transporter subunit IIA [Virgibacillus sp. MSP4-1]